MKVMILVQSVDKPDYIKIKNAQKNTWGSVDHPNVDTVFYLPSSKDDHYDENGDLKIKTFSMHWTHMYYTFAKACRYMLRKEWDYLFKTDNSTYVDKEKLVELLRDKPRIKYFGGMPYPYSPGNVETPRLLWGDGYVLSRDMVEYIVEKFNESPLKGKTADDTAVGQILLDIVKWDTSHVIYEPTKHENNEVKYGSHVYRVRIDEPGLSPALASISDEKLTSLIDSDIKSMYNIHNIITNGKTNHNNIN